MRYFRILSLSSICLLVLTGLIFTNHSVASPLITTTPNYNQHGYLPLVFKNAADVVITPTTVNLQFNEQLAWRETQALTPTQSYDIIVALDYSASMARCWNSELSCVYPNRRIDKVLLPLNNFIEHMLITQNEQGYSHRIGLISFGNQISSGRYGARLDLNFTNDTTRFAFITGLGNPTFKFPSGILTGNTPWAQGLERSIQQLQTTSLDEYGRPRKKAIVFITDGVSNVLFDYPYKGVTNTNYPFKCASSISTINDPLVQYTCPSKAQSYTVRPPVRAAIDVATESRTTDGISTSAILLGSPYSISDMHLDKIAPQFAVKAPEPADIAQIFSDLNVQFQTVQCSIMSETRPAAGANVTIKDASNNLVVQGTTDPNGVFSTTLTGGNYTVEAEHLNIVAPNDSEAISRTYRLASTAFNPINPPTPFLLARDPAAPLCP